MVDFYTFAIMKREKVELAELHDEHIRDLLSVYETRGLQAPDVDELVEKLCKNLIGERVVVVNYPEPDTLYAYKEVVITRVEEQYLYGLDYNLEIKIYIPFNYIYHPAILAALKCI
jgi:hypothetical protein